MKHKFKGVLIKMLARALRRRDIRNIFQGLGLALRIPAKVTADSADRDRPFRGNVTGDSV